MSYLSVWMIRSCLSGFDHDFHDLVSTWLLLMLSVILVTFLVSEITRNYSQVDKLWSLLPVAYGWITAAAFPSARLFLMAALVTVWGLSLAFILIETVADNQLFRFHQEKKNIITVGRRYGKSVEKGFMTEGLWKYARHPNFTSEQAIWVSFYFFGVAASGQWINITLLGPVLLILLFAGSSRLTESISSSKYPEYVDYQKKISRFLPNF